MDESETTDNNDSTVKPTEDNILPKRNEKGQLLPGYTANPKGRPKKKTFRDYFTEEEEEDLINKVKQVVGDKPDILKMAIEHIFGRPQTSVDITTGGEKLTKFTDEQIEDIARRAISPSGKTGEKGVD